MSFIIHYSSTDGEKLMSHLEDSVWLPHVLFLDLNMPCKNGFKCLDDLKSNKNFQHIPVIIYSTSLDKRAADELYKSGAHYYIQKPDVIELKKILNHLLTTMVEKTFTRPPREKFILSITGKIGTNV